jgi:hypothetical protein
MTPPKEKAKELVNKYICTITSDCHHESYCERKECQYNDIVICCTTQKQAKQCALICCDEVLNGEQAAYSFPVEMGKFFIDYFNDVKKEIELL